MSADAVASRNANGTLALLTVIYVFNFIDRQILNILAEPIARELSLSDTQIGLMTGFAFAVFYTFLGIPLARYADRPDSDRITLMAICLAVWAAMTAACGLAQHYGQLLLARIGVGAGEAGCTPAAISIIADIFPKDRRSSAMGIYMMGVPIGSLFGLIAGGWMADAFGWRIALLVVGLPGVVLALLLYFIIKDPRHTGVVSAARPPTLPWREAMRELLASRAFTLLVIATAVNSFLSYGKGVWQIIFFMRSHGLSTSEVGLAIGLTVGICGIIGSTVGGRLADWFGTRNPAHYFIMPAVGFLVAIPFSIAAYSASDWRIAIALMVVPAICGTLNYGPGMSVVQGIFRPQTRATATAVKLFFQTLVGLGLGPLLFGFISETLKPIAGPESVRWVLLGSALLGVIPAVLLWIAGTRLPRELRHPDGHD
jgi:predicted MFS family arabinose efflux permease